MGTQTLHEQHQKGQNRIVNYNPRINIIINMFSNIVTRRLLQASKPSQRCFSALLTPVRQPALNLAEATDLPETAAEFAAFDEKYAQEAVSAQEELKEMN